MYNEVGIGDTNHLYNRHMTTVLMASLLLCAQQTKPFPTGTINLSGGFRLDGRPAKLDIAASPATVLLFIANECPIANRYAPEMSRIFKDYSPKKVAFYRVYVMPLKDAGIAKSHGEEYNLSFTALLDPDRKLVKAVNATVTPEAAVIDRKGKLLYRGRIDDQNVEHGKIREGYRRDLRIALDEILAGKPVSVKETPAVGCFLPGD